MVSVTTRGGLYKTGEISIEQGLCNNCIKVTYKYNIYNRAITKNGYTRSVWSQKRVHPGIKSKIHSTSHAIGQKQIVPVFQRL